MRAFTHKKPHTMIYQSWGTCLDREKAQSDIESFTIFRSYDRTHQIRFLLSKQDPTPFNAYLKYAIGKLRTFGFNLLLFKYIVPRMTSL